MFNNKFDSTVEKETTTFDYEGFLFKYDHYLKVLFIKRPEGEEIICMVDGVIVNVVHGDMANCNISESMEKFDYPKELLEEILLSNKLGTILLTSELEIVRKLHIEYVQ